MTIRKLSADIIINELSRRGYRHSEAYGIILNTKPDSNNEFIKRGVPYRFSEGRIITVEQGLIEIDIDMHTYELRGGDIAVTFPDSLVQVTAISAGSIASAVVFRQMPNLRETAESFVIGSQPETYERARQYMTMIFDQLSRSDIISEVVAHLFDAFILDMCSLPKHDMSSHRNEFMHRFTQLLVHKGRVKHPIDYYADRMCVTPNHLSAKVKRQSGLTVLQWIDRALVREAKVQLRHTTLSIADVAEKLGFSTPSFFIHFFRQQTGLTPLQYRKQAIE